MPTKNGNLKTLVFSEELFKKCLEGKLSQDNIVPLENGIYLTDFGHFTSATYTDVISGKYKNIIIDSAIHSINRELFFKVVFPIIIKPYWSSDWLRPSNRLFHRIKSDTMFLIIDSKTT